MSIIRTYRAGASIEDYCRACKTDRIHTVVAATPAGDPIRVSCGFCRSEHNYRGGPRMDSGDAPAAPSLAARLPGARPTAESASPAPPASQARPVSASGSPALGPGPLPIVSDRERTAPPVMLPETSTADLETLLRRVIREEAGISAVVPADKWRGGTLVLRPGAPGLQEKTWPIETFFHKVVMLRNRLRTLEQQVNASDLPEVVKVRLQSYVTGCYGSLTSFNVLFADDADGFKGSGDE